MLLCDVDSSNSSQRPLGFRLSSSFFFFPFLSFPSRLLFAYLSVQRKFEYCEHSPRLGLGDVCVIASCIAAGFEIPFVSVWGQLVASVE